MVFAVLIFGQKIFTTLTKAFKKYLDQDTALDQTALLGVLDDIDKAGARWVSDSDNVKVMTKYVWVGARQRAVSQHHPRAEIQRPKKYLNWQMCRVPNKNIVHLRIIDSMMVIVRRVRQISDNCDKQRLFSWIVYNCWWFWRLMLQTKAIDEWIIIMSDNFINSI